MMGYMAVILEKDLKRGHDALVQWRAAARELADNTPHRLTVSPVLPRPVWAMAVRYSLFLLERRAPGPGVEVRVAPWGADAGHISAVGERDDLSDRLPL